MNFEQTLNEILEVAKFPQEERGTFIKSFNAHLFQRLFDEIAIVDEASSQELFAITHREGASSADIENVIAEISKNPQVGEKISRTVREVVGELVDDIATAATEEEKQKILAFLPA